MNIPKGDYVNVFKPAVTPGVPTPGIHDPSTPYIPSSEKAYGPKGKWNGKSIQDIEYEGQYSRTLSCVGQDGYIRDASTWEARGKQSESTFRPDPRNFFPREKNWRPAAPLSY